jgi:hypothetical protein
MTKLRRLRQGTVKRRCFDEYFASGRKPRFDSLSEAHGRGSIKRRLHVRKLSRAILSVCFLIAGPAIGGAEDKPFLTTSPTPEYYAWWLRTEYHPFGADIRGIPPGKIRAGWCKVNELRRDMFPDDLALYFGEDKSPFAVDGVFDGSKTRQTALVGVYQTCKGARGGVSPDRELASK